MTYAAPCRSWSWTGSHGAVASPVEPEAEIATEVPNRPRSGAGAGNAERRRGAVRRRSTGPRTSSSPSPWPLLPAPSLPIRRFEPSAESATADPKYSYATGRRAVSRRSVEHAGRFHAHVVP